MFHTLCSPHQCSAQGYSLVIYRQLDYGSEKLISMSKVIIVLFQRTIPAPLTRHTSISSFLRQLWSSVYHLLLVLCAHGLITPDWLVICQYIAYRWAVFLSLCHGKYKQCFTYRQPSSSQGLPELRAFSDFMKALCQVMLHLLVRNKRVHPRRSDLRQPVCKLTTQLPGRKTFPGGCWGVGK